MRAKFSNFVFSLKVRNFSMVHPDFGGRIAKLLELFKSHVSAAMDHAYVHNND